tara:strand:+ start:609 stop:1022 length:414 start_codon:yes stop_codon:yes gene_type:complete
MLIKFIKNHFVKFTIFSFVGLCAFVIDWLFFNLFYKIGSGFILALFIGWIVSMTFNFTLNRNLTFSARGFSIRKQAFKWLIIYFIAFLARTGLGKFILLIIGENPLTANIAFFAGLIVSIPISFLGSLLWVFKKEQN